eukprot:TRINITY_DN11232_c0_g1_i4.p1 TRINITY_DN11232_c0_g1~~TRINITY_DN11232_c0_g1_i4.p1  ORF type:complete len:502 (-),score=57.02 TRINITY_DN11232_c0_g1_i4:48-1553(-)
MPFRSSFPASHPLLVACAQGDLPTLTSLLPHICPDRYTPTTNHLPPNDNDDYIEPTPDLFTTACFTAIQHGHLALLEKFLQTPGFNIWRHAKQALILAISHHHRSILTRLMEVHGFRPQSALTLCAEYGQLDLWQYLYDFFPASNLVLQTSLAIAAQNGHHSVVTYLLSTFNHTLLAPGLHPAAERATEHNHTAIVAQLLQTALPINSHIIDGVFHFASMQGKLDVISLCLEQFEISISTLTEALHAAVSNGHPTLVEKLLSRPGVMAACTPSLIDIAAFSPDAQILDRLLEFIPVEVADLGFPLSNAAQGGNIHTLDRFLQIPGFSTEALDQALGQAAQRGHLDVVKRLVGEAEVSETGRANAAWEAAWECHWPCVGYLVNWLGPDKWPLLRVAAGDNQMDVVGQMLRVESVMVELGLSQSRESVDQLVIQLCVHECGLSKVELSKAHAIGYGVRREGDDMREMAEVVFGYLWQAVLAREVMAWQRKFRQSLNQLRHVRK